MLHISAASNLIATEYIDFLMDFQFEGLIPFDDYTNADLVDAATVELMRNLPELGAGNSPLEVKIIKKALCFGRSVVQVEFDGQHGRLSMLMYRSTGTNFHKTGKASGEWFPIHGFHGANWFVKSKRLVALRNENPTLLAIANGLKDCEDAISSVPDLCSCLSA